MLAHAADPTAVRFLILQGETCSFAETLNILISETKQTAAFNTRCIGDAGVDQCHPAQHKLPLAGRG